MLGWEIALLRLRDLWTGCTEGCYLDQLVLVVPFRWLVARRLSGAALAGSPSSGLVPWLALQ